MSKTVGRDVPGELSLLAIGGPDRMPLRPFTLPWCSMQKPEIK